MAVYPPRIPHYPPNILVAVNPERVKMVERLKTILVGQYGYTITCSRYGEPKGCDIIPGPLGSCWYPDLAGKNLSNNHIFIGQVETCISIQKVPWTKEKIKVFTDYITSIREEYSGAYLHIAVPKNCLADLKRILEELGLGSRNDIITHGI